MYASIYCSINNNLHEFAITELTEIHIPLLLALSERRCVRILTSKKTSDNTLLLECRLTQKKDRKKTQQIHGLSHANVTQMRNNLSIPILHFNCQDVEMVNSLLHGNKILTMIANNIRNFS